MLREEIEMCPHCDNEITVEWDVEKDGYEVTCSECGRKIMLCDACSHSIDNCNRYCDWCDGKCFRKFPSSVGKYRVIDYPNVWREDGVYEVGEAVPTDIVVTIPDLSGETVLAALQDAGYLMRTVTFGGLVVENGDGFAEVFTEDGYCSICQLVKEK